MEELREYPALGIDLNAYHVDAWVLDPSGNPVGLPHTIPLELDDQDASTRNGHVRAAISAILRLATAGCCRSIMVENLNFADARQTGRETSDEAGAADASAGPSQGSPPVGSGTCWSAWPPTTGCG
jgi:hypothetical protein